MTHEPTITVEDIEMSVDALDVQKAADIFTNHGCLVVRGLMAPYVDAIHQDIGRRRRSPSRYWTKRSALLKAGARRTGRCFCLRLRATRAISRLWCWQ